MGLDPPPWEPGALCNFCWGPGKKWPDRPTPHTVRCLIAGLVGLCASANGIYTLTQQLGFPCLFKTSTDRYTISWELGLGTSILVVYDDIRSVLCFGQIIGACKTLFVIGAAVGRIS